MKDKICIFEKFGFCRNGASCKFTHPTLVCDDQNCNIQECSKRHPQACRFFTTLKYCKFGESCKFLHKRKPDETINNEEYKTLEEKYVTLLRNHNDMEEKYLKLQDRVATLEANFFDILRNEIHNIQRVNIEEENNGAMDVNESSSNSNFVKRKADICNADNLNSEDKRNKLNDVTIVSDDEDMEDNIDDANYHEILDYEYDIMKYLIHEIGDIRDNLKIRIIDETIDKLNSLKDSTITKVDELKHLNGQYRYPGSESESEDTFKMMDDVITMVEYLEKLPRNKFRNIAEKDFYRILDQMEWIKNEKINNLHFHFDGPKSFLQD